MDIFAKTTKKNDEADDARHSLAKSLAELMKMKLRKSVGPSSSASMLFDGRMMTIRDDSSVRGRKRKKKGGRRKENDRRQCQDKKKEK